MPIGNMVNMCVKSVTYLELVRILIKQNTVEIVYNDIGYNDELDITTEL